MNALLPHSFRGSLTAFFNPRLKQFRTLSDGHCGFNKKVDNYLPGFKALSKMGTENSVNMV